MTAHADRDRSEQPGATTPDDERVRRYAEAIVGGADRAAVLVTHNPGELANAYRDARAVMAVVDAEQAELRAALTELAPSDEVLVEGSYFPRADLPRILGNFMRSSAEHARMAKDAVRALADERAKVARVEKALKDFRNHADWCHAVGHGGCCQGECDCHVATFRAALAGPEPDTKEPE